MRNERLLYILQLRNSLKKALKASKFSLSQHEMWKRSKMRRVIASSRDGANNFLLSFSLQLSSSQTPLTFHLFPSSPLCSFPFPSPPCSPLTPSHFSCYHSPSPTLVSPQIVYPRFPSLHIFLHLFTVLLIVNLVLFSFLHHSFHSSFTFQLSLK